MSHSTPSLALSDEEGARILLAVPARLAVALIPGSPLHRYCAECASHLAGELGTCPPALEVVEGARRAMVEPGRRPLLRLLRGGRSEQR